MNNPKSLRFKDSLKKNIEDLAAINGISFNKQAAEILREYFEKEQINQTSIGDTVYYPTHLSNEELILILDEFLSNIPDAKNCSVKVRKDSGGKGVDFQINFYIEYKTQIIKKKRYSFSINSNWVLENVTEHWFEESHERNIQGKFLFKKLHRLKIFTIKNIIEETTKHQVIPEFNPIFKEDTWKVLFERKYPVLKRV
jgi:hypothetical protein